MASTANREESAAAGSELTARLNARVMGIETEYGISALAPASPAVPGGFSNAFVEEDLHPMQLSNHVVKAYGASVQVNPPVGTTRPKRHCGTSGAMRFPGPPPTRIS